MKKLKAGIIGLGVGEAHIKGYHKHPNCEVVALCDFSPEKSENAKNKYPHLKICSNADEILTDPTIDVVSIASFDNYHHEQIVKAIENNKHIFVEKPLCLFESEAIDIYERLIQKPHLKISSNLILRLTPRFILLKEKIQKQEMGKVYYIEGDYNFGRLQKMTEGWRGKIPFYSAVYGGGIHLIDLMLWLTHDRVKEVSAVGNKICSEGSSFKNNDMVASLLTFESGMIGKMAVNLGCVQPHFHNLNIYGTEATFTNTFQDYGLYYTSRDKEIEPKKVKEAYPGAEKGDLICNFVDSIFADQEPIISKKDIFDILSVCFAIEKAVNTSQSVKVNYIYK